MQKRVLDPPPSALAALAPPSKLDGAAPSAPASHGATVGVDSTSTARLERPDLALSQPQDKTANGVKMPNVQEVNYNLPETGVAKVPPFAVQARSDGFFARSVGSVPPTAAALRAAARVPRLARGATKPPYVTTSSRTGLPSWRRTVRLLSESGCNSVDKGARRRAPARGLPAGQGLAVLRTVGRPPGH